LELFWGHLFKHSHLSRLFGFWGRDFTSLAPEVFHDPFQTPSIGETLVNPPNAIWGCFFHVAAYGEVVVGFKDLIGVDKSTVQPALAQNTPYLGGVVFGAPWSSTKASVDTAGFTWHS
jgi:hypothetical protein